MVKIHLQYTAVQIYSCFLSVKCCPQNVVAEWRLVRILAIERKQQHRDRVVREKRRIERWTAMPPKGSGQLAEVIKQRKSQALAAKRALDKAAKAAAAESVAAPTAQQSAEDKKEKRKLKSTHSKRQSGP